MAVNSPSTLVTIVSLTLDIDIDTLSTVASASQFACFNHDIEFSHLVVCPNSAAKHKLNGFEQSNYSVSLLRDPGLGIYSAFNLAVEHSRNEGYVIFLSAGDTFKEDVKIASNLFRQDFSLVAFAVNIRSESVDFIFSPYLDGYLRNSIPHSSLFTRVADIKNVGSFPLDLGSAADFYMTAMIVRSKEFKIHIDSRAICTFHLGGVSSNFSSIKYYIKALDRLKLNYFQRGYLIVRKLVSYLKYR